MTERFYTPKDALILKPWLQTGVRNTPAMTGVKKVMAAVSVSEKKWVTAGVAYTQQISRRWNCSGSIVHPTPGLKAHAAINWSHTARASASPMLGLIQVTTHAWHLRHRTWSSCHIECNLVKVSFSCFAPTLFISFSFYVKCQQGSLHSEHLPKIKDSYKTLPLTHWAPTSILMNGDCLGPQINKKITWKHVCVCFF